MKSSSIKTQEHHVFCFQDIYEYCEIIALVGCSTMRFLNIPPFLFIYLFIYVFVIIIAIWANIRSLELPTPECSLYSGCLCNFFIPRIPYKISALNIYTYVSSKPVYGYPFFSMVRYLPAASLRDHFSRHAHTERNPLPLATQALNLELQHIVVLSLQ